MKKIVILLLTTMIVLPAAIIPEGEFSVYSIESIHSTPKIIWQEDFTVGQGRWCPHGGKAGDAGCILHQEEDRPFIRAGEGKRYGHGFRTAAPISVEPGEHCLLKITGRVPDVASTFIVYIKTYDANGKEITENAAPTEDWQYSPWTHTHYRFSIAVDSANSWRDIDLSYQIPEGVHGITVAVCLWRGDYVDCCRLVVSTTGRSTRRRLEFTPVGKDTWRCAEGLRLNVKRKKEPNCTAVRAVIEAEQAKPWALDVEYKLPMDLTGWQWHRHWREDLVVSPGASYCQVATVGTHPVSLYPFTAVSKAGQIVVMGTPFDEPEYEYRRVEADGITSSTAVGLLPNHRQAAIQWILFSFNGSWGFRSAAQKYYELNASAFASRTKPTEEGCWLWPVYPSGLPQQAEDFGLAFWEAPTTVARRPQEIERAHQLHMGVFPYTEAWGMRQLLKKRDDAQSLPSVAERLEELVLWSNTPEGTETWFDAPRHIAAKAALNTLPVQPNGEHPFAVDQYDSWYHWWRTNADPRLPEPNRATLCWDYTIGLDAERIDGVYLDSLSYGFTANYLNVRPGHLAVMTENLIYDSKTGVPCADGMQHQVAFVRWLARKLHGRNKLIFGNTFEIAHRFHGANVDIFGSEVGGMGGTRNMRCVQTDEQSCMKRFYAYHRPVCNLLQEGSYTNPMPEVPTAEIRQYIDHQMFYGFYPGISTIGGEDKPGYANWKRYFGPARQCERDRELFKAAVPLIRRLNLAGWQPETLVRAGDKRILVERYGVTDGELFFTVRNESDQPVSAELVFEVAVDELSLLWGKASFGRKENDCWTIAMQPRTTVVFKAGR